MGDYLYSRAIVELARLGDLDALRVMSRVTNEMTVGEMRQLEAHDVLTYPEEQYDALIRAKTASLMSAACEIGAPARRRWRAGIAAAIRAVAGMAFQVTDDVLDYTESAGVTGKPSGLDLKEHKITLPLIGGVAAHDEGRAARDPAADGRSGARRGPRAVCHRHRGCAGRGGCGARTRGGADGGRGLELEGLPPSAARDALQQCLVYAVERRS